MCGSPTASNAISAKAPSPPARSSRRSAISPLTSASPSAPSAAPTRSCASAAWSTARWGAAPMCSTAQNGRDKEQTPRWPRWRARGTSSSRAGKLAMDTTAAPDVGQAALIGSSPPRSPRPSGRSHQLYAERAGELDVKPAAAGLPPAGWTPDLDGDRAGARRARRDSRRHRRADGARRQDRLRALTYSSIARSANLIGRRSVGVEMDDDGIDPEDFERICAQQHPKLAFLDARAAEPDPGDDAGRPAPRDRGDRPQAQCLAH